MSLKPPDDRDEYYYMWYAEYGERADAGMPIMARMDWGDDASVYTNPIDHNHHLMGSFWYPDDTEPFMVIDFTKEW